MRTTPKTQFMDPNKLPADLVEYAVKLCGSHDRVPFNDIANEINAFEEAQRQLRLEIARKGIKNVPLAQLRLAGASDYYLCALEACQRVIGKLPPRYATPDLSDAES